MPATFDQIETALISVWTTGWSSTTYTAYENVDFDTSVLDNGADSWMELRIIPGPQNLIDMKKGFVGSVDLIISAHTPIGVGKEKARQLLDTATALYQGDNIAAGTSSLHAYSISGIVQLPSDGWYKMAVQVSFRLI